MWITVHEPDNANDTLTCSSASCVALKLGTTTIATAGHANLQTDEETHTSTTQVELGPLYETSQGSQD